MKNQSTPKGELDDSYDELDKVLDRLIGAGVVYGSDSTEIHLPEEHAKARADILKNYISKQELTEALKEVLVQGHGGGNWRRLITWLKEKFGVE